LTQENGARHDGHPGWRIDQLGNTTGGALSFFANWTAYNPDSVLLMAGTNDISTVRVFRQDFALEDAIGSHAFLSGVHCSYHCHHKSCRNTEGQLYNISCDKTVTPWQCSVDNILHRLDRLIAQILAALPHTTVFVSDIVGIGPKPCYGPDPQAIGNDMVLNFNKGLPEIAAKYQSSQVVHVPLLTETGIGEHGGEGLCPCQYHPTHTSYAKMAAVYAKAIQTAFNLL
jgi:lysophospholipase L1-like esterase